MKLDIIECKGCGVLFSDSNKSIKHLYFEESDTGQHVQYLDCPICKHKTVIWKDWAWSYEKLKEDFGENNFSIMDGD